jgi:ribosome-binding protein aMBF1 (putative translation factor)
MNECFKCGASGGKTRLFDVISKKGISKICAHCFAEEDLPLIKRPTTNQIKDSEKQKSYRDRIETFNPSLTIHNSSNEKEEASLREIIDKNLKMDIKAEVKPRPYLIDHFHWVIMRERRARHISRDQFAKDLGESETLIKMVEQGILPEEDNLIINKIESYLHINLRKPEFREQEQKKDLGFDSVSVKNLTISDIRELKEKRDEDIFLKPVEVWEGDIEADSEEKVDEKKEKEEDLSQEDIDDLIFGK